MILSLESTIRPAIGIGSGPDNLEKINAVLGQIFVTVTLDMGGKMRGLITLPNGPKRTG